MSSSESLSALNVGSSPFDFCLVRKHTEHIGKRLVDAYGACLVCVVPGSMEVDLKVASRISGNKNCEMVHVKELFALTGYIRGGCTPIGMKKPYPVFVHESALLYDYIYISAGQRGEQLRLRPSDLIEFVHAGIYPL